MLKRSSSPKKVGLESDRLKRPEQRGFQPSVASTVNDHPLRFKEPKGGREHSTKELDTLRDCDLLNAFAQRRDDACFDALVRRHAGLVLGVCQRTLTNKSEAEDVAQCVFMTLAKKACEVSRHVSLAGWLHKAALNESRNFRKRHARLKEREHQASAAMTRESGNDRFWQELKPIMDEELNAIPQEWREPLILHHIEGYSHEDGAKRLNLSVGTFASRISRARDALRERLSQRGMVVPSVVLGTIIGRHAAASEIPADFVQTAVAASIKERPVLNPRRAAPRTKASGASASTLVAASAVLAGVAAVWFVASQSPVKTPPPPVAATVAITPQTSPTAKNELFNGDFERLDPNGIPSGWTWPNSPNIRLENDGTNTVAVLSVASPDKPRTVVTRLNLDPTWKRLRISARFQIKGLKHGEKNWQNARLNLRFEDDRGQTIQYTGGPSVQADVEWAVATITADPPPGAAKLVLEPGVFGDAGTLRVDDIVVEANPEWNEPPLPPNGVRLTFQPGLLQNEGWMPWDPSATFSALTPETPGAFLRLTTARREGVGATRWYRLPSDGRFHRLAVRGRARVVRLEGGDGSGMGPNIQCRFMTPGGAAANRLVPIVSRSEGWAPFSGQCDIPAGATLLELTPALIAASGTVDIAELEVTPLP